MSDKNLFEDLQNKQEYKISNLEAEQQRLRDEEDALRQRAIQQENAQKAEFFENKRSLNRKSLRSLIGYSTYSTYERNIEGSQSLNVNLESLKEKINGGRVHGIKETQELDNNRTQLSARVSNASHRFAKTRKSRLKTSAAAMKDVSKYSRNILNSLDKSKNLAERGTNISNLENYEKLFAAQRKADRNMAEAISGSKSEEKQLKEKADRAYYTRLLNIYSDYLAQAQDRYTDDQNLHKLTAAESAKIRAKMDEAAKNLLSVNKSKNKLPKDIDGEIKTGTYSESARAYLNIEKMKKDILNKKAISPKDFEAISAVNRVYYEAIFTEQVKGPLQGIHHYEDLLNEYKKLVVDLDSAEQKKRYLDQATEEEVIELEEVRQKATNDFKEKYPGIDVTFNKLSVKSLRIKRRLDNTKLYRDTYVDPFTQAQKDSFVSNSKNNNNLGLERCIGLGLKYVELDENGDVLPEYKKAHEWNIKYLKCMTRTDEKSLLQRKDMLEDQMRDYIGFKDKIKEAMDPDYVLTDFAQFYRIMRLNLGIREVLYRDGNNEKIMNTQVDPELLKEFKKMEEGISGAFGVMLKSNAALHGVDCESNEYVNDGHVENAANMSATFTQIFVDQLKESGIEV